MSLFPGSARRSEGDTTRTYKVSAIVAHSEYFVVNSNITLSTGSFFIWDYDIALLRLEKPVEPSVAAVSLPAKDFSATEMQGMQCKSAGMSDSWLFIFLEIKVIFCKFGRLLKEKESYLEVKNRRRSSGLELGELSPLSYVCMQLWKDTIVHFLYSTLYLSPPSCLSSSTPLRRS